MIITAIPLVHFFFLKDSVGIIGVALGHTCAYITESRTRPRSLGVVTPSLRAGVGIAEATVANAAAANKMDRMKKAFSVLL